MVMAETMPNPPKQILLLRRAGRDPALGKTRARVHYRAKDKSLKCMVNPVFVGENWDPWGSTLF